MTASIPSRRAVLVASLALLASVQVAPAADSQKIRVSGTWAVTLVHTRLEGTRTGVASPGGPVDGVFSGKQVKNDAWGVGVLDFGNGDTLTYDFEATYDPAINALVGTWVVTGGTGKYSGATGGGTSFAPVTGPGTGEFEYVGTISF